MAHRYQSRFSYRPLGEYMLGEYLRPTGFGTYTLGSLSNRPGKDWATPRYVRDEPDKFMSGYGDEYDDIQAQYEADKALIDAGGVPADLVTDIQEGPPAPPMPSESEFNPFDPSKGPVGPYANPVEREKAEKSFLDSLSDTAKKYATAENLAKGLDLVNKGLATVQQVDQMLKGGGSIPAPTTIPIPDYQNDYDYNYNPIPVTTEGVRSLSTTATRIKSGVFLSPQFTATHVGVPVYKPGTVTPNTMLLLAGAAVVAFLVLGKK